MNFGRLTEIGALRRLANIAREDGLASWIGTTQTFLVGLTAWGFWWLARASGAGTWRQGGWFLVAALFTYMAIDDGVQLHERIGTAYDAIATRGAGRFPSFRWQPLFLPLFAVAGAAAFLFLWWELRGRWAKALIAGAALLFAAAVVLDFLEGLDANHPWNLYAAAAARYDIGGFTEARFRQNAFDTLAHFSRSLEEFAEMFANTCLWTAILGDAGWAMMGIRIEGRTATR